MSMLSLYQPACRAVRKHAAKVLILLTVVAFSGLWWQAINWYESYLVEQEKIRTSQGTNQYASKLSTLVHQRFALLQGLASFVERTLFVDLIFPLVVRSVLKSFCLDCGHRLLVFAILPLPLTGLFAVSHRYLAMRKR